MQPWAKNYLIRLGAKNINQDMYALSVLVQWIFRSAIRNGEKISIYIPSQLMRFLLTQWIENLAIDEDLKEIKYMPIGEITNKKMKDKFDFSSLRNLGA